MNKDSLFFFIFMVCAMIYMVVAQHLRQWADKKKKERREQAGHRPPSSSFPGSAPAQEKSHTIREILKRAAEGTLLPTEGPVMPPLPKRVAEPLVERRKVNPPPIPWGMPPLPTKPEGLPVRTVPPTARPTPSIHLVRIQAALRQSKSVRDAVILSEILQPPKALR